MPIFVPINPPRDPNECPSWLYEVLQRLNRVSVTNSSGLTAITRGLTPDGSGLPLVDTDKFFYKPGLSGGQLAYGGTGGGDDLTLSSTASAGKGSIFLGSAQTSSFDEVNQRLGLNVAPSVRLHTKHTAIEAMQRWEGPSFDVASCVSNGTTTVTSSAGFGSVVIGMVVTGSLVPASTVVSAVASSSSITLSNSVPAGTTTMTFTLLGELGMMTNSTSSDVYVRATTGLQILSAGLQSGIRLTEQVAENSIIRAFIEAGPTNQNFAITGFNGATGNSLGNMFTYTTFNTWSGTPLVLGNAARVGVNTNPFDYRSSAVASQPGSLIVARMTGATAGVATVIVEGSSASTEGALEVHGSSTGSAPTRIISSTILGGFRHNGDIMLCNSGVKGLLKAGAAAGGATSFMLLTDSAGVVAFNIGNVAAWSDTLAAASSFFFNLGTVVSTHRAAFLNSDGFAAFTRFGISSQYTLISNGQAGGANFPAPDGAGSPTTLRVYDAATGGFDAGVVLKVESARTTKTGNLISVVSAVTGNVTFAVDNKAFLQASIKSSSFVVDSADLTKKIALDLSGITTATTRTLVVPNRSSTIATLDGDQTFTGQNTHQPTTAAGVITFKEDASSTGTSFFVEFRDGSGNLFGGLTSAGNTGVSSGFAVERLAIADLTGPFFATLQCFMSGDRTIQFPDFSGTVCIINATQNIANKTLTTTGNLLKCSTASSGVGFSDNTTAAKQLRIVLSGAASANHSITIANAAARDYKFGDDSGTVNLVVAPTSATTDKTGQTGNVGATTVYTTVHAGMYRISFYVVFTAVTAAGNLTVTGLWTDPQQAQTATINEGGVIAYAAAGSFLQGRKDVYCTSGSTIQFSTTLTGTGTYNVYVRVEALT